MKSLFSGIGWLFSKAWWLLDGTRRALMNLIVLLLIIIVVTAIVTRGPKPLADKTTLVLKLDGNLVEQFSGSPREQLMAQAQGRGVPKQTRLRDVLAALDQAARDDKISAVLLDVENFDAAGLAGLHEVSAALQRFKKSGKPVLVHAEVVSDDDAGLPAGADGMDYASWVATRPLRCALLPHPYPHPHPWTPSPPTYGPHRHP